MTSDATSDVTSGATESERVAFVHAHTAPREVPFVPEVKLFTVTELTPLWRATEAWLDARSLAVPYWCVAWAGGQALARWVLDHPEAVHGKDVVDFGAGSGLVAIAAKKAGASRVRAVDIDPFAWTACALNAELNGVAIDVVRASDDLDPAFEADVVLAGDVWYERAPAARFCAWLRTLRARVISGDPGRSYAPQPDDGARDLAIYDVPTSQDLESVTTRRTRVFELARNA